MDPSSNIAIQARIRALETALSHCKTHRMIQDHYALPQTKPRRPSHDVLEILSIWIDSTSYIDYYSNIAKRLEALKSIFEAQRLQELRSRSYFSHHPFAFAAPTATPASPPPTRQTNSSISSLDEDYDDTQSTGASSDCSGSSTQSTNSGSSTSTIRNNRNARAAQGAKATSNMGQTSGKHPRKSPMSTRLQDHARYQNQCLEAIQHDNPLGSLGDFEDSESGYASPTPSLTEQLDTDSAPRIHFGIGNAEEHADGSGWTPPSAHFPPMPFGSSPCYPPSPHS
ncbi:hypothetical protein EDD11_008191 [Mortierella claussenii]|nr:hypothetical protein EDD11_008191 [Mortierella claussenii]